MTTHPSKEKIILLVSDFIAVNLSYVVCYQLRFRAGIFPAFEEVPLIVPSLVVSLLWILMFALRGHYRTLYRMSRFDAFTTIARTTFFGVLIIFFATSSPQHPLGPTRLINGIYWGLLMVTVGGARVLIRTGQRELLRRGIGHRNTLVIGSGTEAQELIKQVERHPELGHHIIGYLDGQSASEVQGFPPNMGMRKDLSDVLNKQDIREVMVALSAPDHQELLSIISECSYHKVRVSVIPDLYEILSGRARTHQIWGMPLIEVEPELMPPWQRVAKEVMDVLVALILLILALPLMLLVSLIIVLDSPGGVFYRQLRVGKDRKEFTLIKFRSMVKDAESQTGAVWAEKNDPRITRVGRIIRNLRIDELPQFINVLKGEMSLVGPRPERPEFVNQFITDIPFYARRLNVKPGITGWAQVKYKYDESIEDVRRKLRYDLFYLENMSLRLDLKILLATAWVMLIGKGH